MDAIKYVDTETWQLLTENQLLSEFLELKKGEETEAENFANYLSNCMTRNNGTLETVEKVTEEEIRHMLHDEYIAESTANMLMTLELYKTRYGSFYSTDERYFFNVDDLNTIAEI
jgi:flagellar hook-basal body complex protein FliE